VKIGFRNLVFEIGLENFVFQIDFRHKMTLENQDPKLETVGIGDACIFSLELYKTRILVVLFLQMIDIFHFVYFIHVFTKTSIFLLNLVVRNTFGSKALLIVNF